MYGVKFYFRLVGEGVKVKVKSQQTAGLCRFEGKHVAGKRNGMCKLRQEFSERGGQLVAHNTHSKWQKRDRRGTRVQIR